MNLELKGTDMDLAVIIDLALGGTSDISIFVGEEDWISDVSYDATWYLTPWVREMTREIRIKEKKSEDWAQVTPNTRN